ncbi:MAG: autotransporter-associated beta strand repeat-containing protein [Verrucomicrobia bacterium]|nr:autotransporter-associated beta strand repeat-containing protein [Verrucomicrobiota bacterium]
MLTVTAPAATLWIQAAGGDFNTPGNWDTNTVPGAGDTALFNIAMSGNVTLSANAMPGSISFDTDATSFSLGALAGNTITLANGGSISILSTLTATNQTFTINAPLILTPDSTTTPGAFTIQNDGMSASTILVIAGGISSSTTSGTETLTLAGSNTGANLVSGAIANGGAASLTLTKSGAGTWTLTAANTYTGGTNIAAGTLVLSGGNNRLLSTGVLNFTGSSGTLDVGSTSQTLGGLTFLTAGVNSNVITGAGGTLSITGGNIQIGGGDTTTATALQTVDMSGLGAFNYTRTSGSFNVGGTGNSATGTPTASGILTMAVTNTITAQSFNVGFFTTGSGALNSGTVHMGQTNTINASTILVGTQKTTALLDFQNLTAPTLKIRGTGGTDSDRAFITVGTENSGITATVATVDLTSGGTVSSTLDAMVSTLMIGQNLRNTNSAGQPATGTFIMGLGTLNATAIVIGQQDSTVVVTTGGAATGTLSLKGGSIITTTLTLADKKTNAAGMAQALTSNFNFYSGTLNATTIQRGGAGTGAGANSATINFNWVDGTIGNVAGADMIVSGNTALNGLTGGLNIVLNNSGNTSGTHAWNVSGTQTATLQNTVTLSGAGGLTKTGTGMLVLAGPNSYAGLTLITTGTLQFGLETSLYNGNTANWTATNLQVSSGATAAFNVGGAGEFTAADIDLLKALGTATTGFMKGSFLGLDTTNAGGVFTYASVITNTNSGINTLGLIKLGSGTLQLTGANIYTGGTSIAAGTLALSGGNNRLLSSSTLSFTGSSGTLDVGSTSQTLAGLLFPTVGTASHVITGAGGTLTVNSGSIQIGGGNATASGSETLDMSGLSNFNYTNTSGNFSVGGQADNNSGAITGSGTLTLAMTNTITAANFKINPFSTGLSSLNTGTVHLGQTNTINASTILIGEQKTIALLDFQSGLVSPTLKIRGTGGTDADRATVTVGFNGSGVLVSDSTVDLTTGVTGGSILDAKISTLLIAQAVRNASAGKAVSGTFLMGQGTMDVTTIILGQQAAVTAGNSSSQATATLSLSGGTITVTTFTLADKLSGAAAQTITSNFNLYSGTLNATTIQRGTAGTGAGADTATINFNWVDGTIGNVANADMTVNGNSALNGLTGGLNIVLNDVGNLSGTHTWNVSGLRTATIQSTAILSGTGGLTKTGLGTLVFASANTYTGLTNVTAGELDLNTTGGQAIAGNLTVNGGTAKLLQSSQINSAKNLVVSSGTFALQGFNQTLAGVQITGGSITGTTGILTSTSAYDIQAGVVSAILAGSAGLSKTTAGTAYLSGANTYSGGTTVTAGTLIGASTSALGTNSGLSITSGATFAYRPTAAGSLSIGSGVLSLAGGSTIGTALGGTASQSVITSTAAASASGSIGVALYFIPAATLTTGTNNLITVASGLTSGGATYTLTKLYNATNFTVSNVVATDTTLSINVASLAALTTAYWKGGLSAGSNVWALSDGTASNWVTNSNGTGSTPLVPGSGAVITFSATGATNQGDMVLGANMSIKSLTASNTNAVTLNADGNTLTIATSAGITVNSGAGAVTLNAPITLGVSQTWTNNSSNLLTIGGLVSGSVTLTSTGSGNTLISGGISGTGAVTKSGIGTLTLAGASTTTGTLTITAGTANLTGSYTGAVSVASTGTVATANLSGSNYGAINIAGGSNSIGIANILAGANLTGTSMGIGVGGAAGSSGAVYQSGGDVLLNNNLNLGLGGSAVAGSYGFYSMSGGTINDTGGSNVRFRIGGGGSYSTGLLYQTGGTVNINYAAGLEVGANGTGNFVNSNGVAYLTGGTITAISNRIGYNSSAGSSGGIRGEETIAGSALVTINGSTILTIGAGDTGILNLNGGTYATKQITRGNASAISIINFNGGVLKAAASASSTFLTGLTTANVFAGGLTVDTNGQSLTIGQSLLAPAGSGVATIAVTNGGSGYVGAPYVSISGTGSGATAVANMVDDGTGNGTFKIASITITSPGTGYTGTPTVTLTGGGGTGAVLDAAVLVANTSGGMTKTGAGTLTLSGTNTYTGATVVNYGGTLVAGSTSAFGVNSAATVDGTLRLAGKSNALGSLAGSTSGTVENANATTAMLTVGGDNSSQNFSGVIQDGSGGGALILIKVGTGVQTLSGANTYTGTTTVSQGTLQVGVAGLGSTASGSAVSVNGATAILAGSGMISGAVTVTSGLIQPGDAGGTSVGTLSVGSLNLTNGGAAVFQIEGVSLNDRIIVLNAGGLTLDGKVSVTTSLTGTDFSTAFVAGSKYDLLDWSGVISGTFDVGTLVRNGSQDNALQFDLPDLSTLGLYWDVSSFLTDGSILVVVPEPSRAMLLLLAMGCALFRRRRQLL